MFLGFFTMCIFGKQAATLDKSFDRFGFGFLSSKTVLSFLQSVLSSQGSHM